MGFQLKNVEEEGVYSRRGEIISKDKKGGGVQDAFGKIKGQPPE